MKAEDVMSDEKIMEYTRAPIVLSGHRRLAEASFRAGIKEVVEWLEKYKKIKLPKYQLEEWGL